VTTTPPEAVVLARTPDGSPQVIRLGARAWGVQFHPEADAAIVSVWADRTVAAGELSRSETDVHLAEITAADRAVGPWEQWARRFAAMIVSPPGAAPR
jgi:GMP synthase-like glutamine amidotransferase